MFGVAYLEAGARLAVRAAAKRHGGGREVDPYRLGAEALREERHRPAAAPAHVEHASRAQVRRSDELEDEPHGARVEDAVRDLEAGFVAGFSAEVPVVQEERRGAGRGAVEPTGNVVVELPV